MGCQFPLVIDASKAPGTTSAMSIKLTQVYRGAAIRAPTANDGTQQAIRVRRTAICPAILVFCCIGVYIVNNSVFDVFLTAGFNLLSHIIIKPGCEGSPLLLGSVLGPMMEENFRRSLLLTCGDFSVLRRRTGQNRVR